MLSGYLGAMVGFWQEHEAAIASTNIRAKPVR